MTDMPATALSTDRLINLGDVQIDVSEVGSGEPLVLVCGTSQSKHLWAPLVSALAQSHRVITYDHRGIGESSRGVGDISVESLAEDLSRLLTALGLESTGVLGWSLGSAVAQQLAIAHPEQVTSLTLLNTWAKTNVYQSAVFSALGHPWRTNDREVALAALGLAFSPEFLDSESFPEVMGQVEPVFPRTQVAMQTVADQWDADLRHDTTDRLASIGVPTLVVTAEQDLLTPPGLGQAVARLIPNSEVYEFTGPGASHAVLLERPDEVAATVREFLDRTVGAARS